MVAIEEFCRNCRSGQRLPGSQGALYDVLSKARRVRWQTAVRPRRRRLPPEGAEPHADAPTVVALAGKPFYGVFVQLAQTDLTFPLPAIFIQLEAAETNLGRPVEFLPSQNQLFS